MPKEEEYVREISSSFLQMKFCTLSWGKMQSWTRWSAWLCLSLMLRMAAESVHSHPTHTESAPCSICVVANSAQPAVASATTAPILATIGVLQEQDVLAEGSAIPYSFVLVPREDL
jgi:hypothetical protein